MWITIPSQPSIAGRTIRMLVCFDAGFDNMPYKVVAVLQIGDIGIFLIMMRIIITTGYIDTGYIESSLLKGQHIRLQPILYLISVISHIIQKLIRAQFHPGYGSNQITVSPVVALHTYRQSSKKAILAVNRL